MTKENASANARCFRRRVGTVLAVAALVLPTTLVAMSDTSGAVTSTDAAASNHLVAHAAGGVAAAEALIKKFTGVPKFVAPGPKLNPASLKGKTMYTIFSSTAIGFCSDVAQSLTKAAAKFGIKNDVWPNAGEQSQWVQGFNAAIAAHAALINVGCGINAAALAPQIAAARKAGIPVVTAHSYDPSQTIPSSLAAAEYAPYKMAGELEAAWVIKETNGAGNVLVVDDVADDVSTPALVAGIKLVFGQDCAACTVTYQDVPIPSWSTQIGSVVSAALASNSKLDYIIPVYDGMVGFVLPALTEHNATNVKISTFNGTPAVMNEMRTGDVVTFDCAENFPWIGLATLDQDMRVMLGSKPAKDEVAPLQVWTKANVADTGIPSTYSKGYGTSAQSGFNKLW